MTTADRPLTPFELDQWRETVAERCDLPVSALVYLDDAEEIRAVARYLVRVRVWEVERRCWRRFVALALCAGAVNGFLAALGYWPLVLAVVAGAGALVWHLGTVAGRAHRGRWWLETARPSRAPWRPYGPAGPGPGPDVPPGRPRPGPRPDVPLNRPDDLWQAWGDALKLAEAVGDACREYPSGESFRRWWWALERVEAARDAYEAAERSAWKDRIA